MNEEFHLLPQAASSLAESIDSITLGLTLISGVVLLIVAGMIVGFGIRYRQGSSANRMQGGQDLVFMELIWSVPLFTIFLALFFWASLAYMQSRNPPPDATEIFVLGRQWWWEFQHHQGIRELNELHVPVGKPILLTLTSQDVIHSFYVPVFRIKQDVLPGRYVQTWFQATRPGKYHLFCTEYCGTSHADMRGWVHAQEPHVFEEWLSQAQSTRAEPRVLIQAPSQNQDQTLSSRGEKLYQRMGCVSCHEGQSAIRAPRLAGLYGTQVRLTTGEVITADENYIRESIVQPQAKVVAGYDPVMPPFGQSLNETEIIELIAYLRGKK